MNTNKDDYPPVWDKYRNEFGELDLVAIYRDKNGGLQETGGWSTGCQYLASVGMIHPIKSRQAAAVAFATAALFDTVLKGTIL